MSVGFVVDVRQELAKVPSPDPALEVGVLLRLGGRWHRRSTAAGTATSIELVTRSGAVARRAFALLRDIGAPAPHIWVRAPGGVHARSTYGLHVEDAGVMHRVGVLDGDGRPVAGLPAGATDDPPLLVRAALLACGSVSTPGRPVHLEFAMPSHATAVELATVLTQVVGSATVTDEERQRVVVKSGTVVADLLALAGAPEALAVWQQAQMRHEIRAAANRLANADTANLRRTVSAARDQIDAVERVVDAHGWHGFDPDVRNVALARVANPAASLEELGELQDPPMTRSAVHRRLARIRELAAELDRDDG